MEASGKVAKPNIFRSPWWTHRGLCFRASSAKSREAHFHESRPTPSKEGWSPYSKKPRFRALPAWESTTSKELSGTKERGEEMLVMVSTELLDGLLSGLEAQSELSALLEELYYEGLS